VNSNQFFVFVLRSFKLLSKTCDLLLQALDHEFKVRGDFIDGYLVLLDNLLKFNLNFSELANLHNQPSDLSLLARKSFQQNFDLLDVLVNLNLHLDAHLRYFGLNKDLLLCEPSPLVCLHLLNDYSKSLLLL